VRWRTTFTNCDSSASASRALQLGTCEHYAHILAEYSDAELLDIIDVSSGSAPSQLMGKSSSRTAQYKEVQIHGPIQLDRDVELLVLNSQHQSSKAAIDSANVFCEKFGIGLITLS